MRSKDKKVEVNSVRKEEQVRRIEWLLKKSVRPKAASRISDVPPDGSLVEVNTCRVLLDAVGEDVLRDIARDFLDLLDTSAAIYEVNGDYALGIFTSGWCCLLDQASRKLCGTKDTREAMANGKWLCHESCWGAASKRSIETGQPVDIKCFGGIHIYAVPIWAGSKIVGSINFGYGDPPIDPKELAKIAQKYGLNPDDLFDQARSYESRPAFIIELAKRRVLTAARLIGLIVERKQAIEELQESEARYSTLVEEARDGIVIIQDGVIKYVNRSIKETGGYSSEELRGRSFLDMVSSEFRAAAARRYHARLAGEEIVPLFEAKIKCKNGNLKDVEVSSSHIQYNKKPAVMAILRDVTKRKKTEEELLKVQKLESLGVLAGGIAHDFNNLLAAIIGNLSMIEAYAKTGDNIFEVLEETKKASQQARRLTQQLLAFSTGGKPVKKDVSFSKLLKNTVELTLSGSRLRCELFLPDDLWWVEVDKGQIIQVISNLLINSDQAMPEGGVVKIWGENLSVGPHSAWGLKEGQYVKISIKDQGVGISQEYLDKIFDPYFTTKQKGSGLGLAIAYVIIKNHGGRLGVESKLGVGTTFYIYLPASKRQAFAVSPELSEGKLFTGQGRILFMDDQEGIRNMVKRMLTHLGYEVELTSEGKKAVAVYKQAQESGQPFDLVVLDLTVPDGMGGEEAIRKLQEIDPGVKAIVSSGYSNDPIMSEYKRYGFRGVVVKPYNIKALSKILSEVIKE